MTAMRAAVLRGTGAPAPYARSRPLSIETVELQPPGRGEVRVRVRAAGLCHSDLSVIDGSRPRPLPMLAGMVAVVLLRLASIFWGLRIPVFALADDEEEPADGAPPPPAPSP